MLRTVKTRRDKTLRFDSFREAGETITWFAAYLGKQGWSAARGNGEWMDDPSEDAVEWALQNADETQIVDRSDLPDEVEI